MSTPKNFRMQEEALGKLDEIVASGRAKNPTAALHLAIEAYGYPVEATVGPKVQATPGLPRAVESTGDVGLLLARVASLEKELVAVKALNMTLVEQGAEKDELLAMRRDTWVNHENLTLRAALKAAENRLS